MIKGADQVEADTNPVVSAFRDDCETSLSP